MHRSIFAFVALLGACDAAPPPELETATQGLAIDITRDQIAGDVYHYGFVLRLGDGPNAQIHLHRVVRERAPWRPRATTGAVMMMHGDFATFATNFAPLLGNPPSTATGIATYLAQRGIDVWGFDRRWTQAPAEGADLSDFNDMGIDQELDDIGVALTFARTIRLVTDGSLDRMTLIGFSRGGQLAYYYASAEAARPSWQRHVKGLVPLDVYASLSPADEDLRQLFCQFAFFEYLDLGAGIVDTPNGFQIATGELALSAPDDPTPFTFPLFAGLTNREVMLMFSGQTYIFFPASQFYHLAAPVLDGDFVTGLRESSETVIATWYAGAAPHQSLREAADTDALLCGEAPLPADVPLSRIRVPLFYLGAAGAYGDHGLHSTTQVSSTDVETLVVRRFGPEREAEDFGHGDLLFATDAPQLAWQPLLSWLRRH